MIGVSIIGTKLGRGISAIRVFTESIIGLVLGAVLSVVSAFAAGVALMPAAFFSMVTNQNKTIEAKEYANNLLSLALLTGALLVITAASYLISIEQRHVPQFKNKVRSYFAFIYASLMVAALVQGSLFMLISVVVASLAFQLTHVVWSETKNWAETSVVVGVFIGFSLGASTGDRLGAVLCMLWGAIAGYFLAKYYYRYSDVVEEVVEKIYLGEQ